MFEASKLLFDDDLYIYDKTCQKLLFYRVELNHNMWLFINHVSHILHTFNKNKISFHHVNTVELFKNFICFIYNWKYRTMILIQTNYTLKCLNLNSV